VERIESALEDFPGALLMVTHDETFATRTTKTTWTLHAGGLSLSSARP
jgi:ATPase subunit of ABC transporter with duplicated ATPase domains